MLEKLRNRCDLLMNKDKKKYSLIKNILEYDNCFNEMNIDDAFSILADLEVKDIKKVYMLLTKGEN